MRLPLVLAFLACHLATLSGCAALRGSPPGCLDLADTNAGAPVLRDAAKNAAQVATAAGPLICEGLALLAEKKWPSALQTLEKALVQVPAEEQWAIQGYIARALLETSSPHKALQAWDLGIEGAIKAKHLVREHVFRGDRAIAYARRSEFGPALEDIEEVFTHTQHDAVKLNVSYLGLKIAVSAKNMKLAKLWYDRNLPLSREIDDAQMQRNAAEIYAQMLDGEHRYEESEGIYADAEAAIARSGSKYEEADILEFHGQSRFEAGDYRGGERYFGEAAQKYREAGQAEYADYLERQLRSRLDRFERGYACFDFIAKGNYSAAEQSVLDVAPERRRADANACMAQAVAYRGDPGRARLMLGSLIEKTRPGSDCESLRGVLSGLGRPPPPINPTTSEAPPSVSGDQNVPKCGTSLP